ncbi:VOC family protein [Chitinophagaceae bacterium MMS25-I14]
MKLNHINLTVPDVAATKTFFETYFNFRCTEVKGDQMLAVLYGEDDFILVLSGQSFNRNGNHTYPDAFHVGFILDNKQQVSDKYRELVAGGIVLQREPGSIHGAYGFYLDAPGNILVEVSTYNI